MTDGVYDIAVTINEIDDPVECAAALAKNWLNASRKLLPTPSPRTSQFRRKRANGLK